jgi:hypothetical protein
MKRRILGLVLIVFAMVISFHTKGAQSKEPPQELSAQCVATVPKEWGEFVGSSSYGVAFKDSAGTLRFVTHFSCGFKTPPHVALAVQRN